MLWSLHWIAIWIRGVMFEWFWSKHSSNDCKSGYDDLHVPFLTLYSHIFLKLLHFGFALLLFCFPSPDSLVLRKRFVQYVDVPKNHLGRTEVQESCIPILNLEEFSAFLYMVFSNVLGSPSSPHPGQCII